MAPTTSREIPVSTTDDGGTRMMKSVVQGVLIGLPVIFVGITLAVWIFTDRDFGAALTTAILPGILTGVFFGGFAGMARTMD